MEGQDRGLAEVLVCLGRINSSLLLGGGGVYASDTVLHDRLCLVLYTLMMSVVRNGSSIGLVTKLVYPTNS